LPSIEGLAAPWSQPSVYGVGGKPAIEYLKPGCFIWKDRPVFACVNHRKRFQLATTADDLTLWENDIGIWFRVKNCDLPRNCTGVSVNFTPQKWRRLGDNEFLLTKAVLRHVSILLPPHQPAFQLTAQHLKEIP
jgi:hypothetical protein